MALIDTYTLKKRLRTTEGASILGHSVVRLFNLDFLIDNTPTIDAVPVVRCKDCKHFAHCEEVEGVSWTGFCNYGEFHTDEEDFCSRGERRSDD